MSNPIHRRIFFQSMSTIATGDIGTPLALALQTSAQQTGSLPSANYSLVKTPAGYVHPNRVLLWENTRREIRELLHANQLKAAILPTGSVEQHNEHMAMASDVAIATLICQSAALELYPKVIVAPPSPCGYAPYHMARKGSMTLRRETFEAYVLDVMPSLKAHGIHTILVLNGHGGNVLSLREALPGWRKQLGINIDSDSYASGTPEKKPKKSCDPKNSPHTRASLKLHFTWPPFPVGCARSPCRITITRTSIMNRGSRRKLKKCYYVINVHLRMVRLTVLATTRRTAADKKKRSWHGPRLERNSSRWSSNMWPIGCGK